MFTPSAINSSTARLPSGVPGTLINTFGRLTKANSRLASATVAAVSLSIPGGTSRET